jgi:EAL domain-containing protein (putative c-di-GMP-specific phosphodiesterase class I)
VADGRLLILDDDPQVGRMIQMIAESAGFEARALIASEQFFPALDVWQPTHIAIDLVMPDMDGVQVLVQLAALHCRARIIITSGVGTRVLDAARRSGDEHGLDIAGVLSKPFSPKALRELLRQPAPLPGADRRLAGVATTAVHHAQTEPSAAELAEGIAAGHIRLAYQPQVECSSGNLAGVEALARWHHPLRGVLAPNRFIPLAERHGLMDELTFAVVRQALDWFLANFAACTTGASAPPTLSVNISASVLRDAQFVERLSDFCRGSGIEPSRLIFELTETSAMEDPVASLDILTRLRMKGFQLSIDDFGTGFSSMLQLVRLPFSEIKIDKSFVITATRSSESLAVVRSIIELGHSLELRVVAEGVEDEATLRQLQELGCDVAQGFYLGRPAAGEELLAQLARDAAAGTHAAPQSMLL